MQESLQATCRELDLCDISEIPLCLSKLKAVVRTVPRMEEFISRICNFVFQRELHRIQTDGEVVEGGGKDRFTMSDVPLILER